MWNASRRSASSTFHPHYVSSHTAFIIMAYLAKCDMATTPATAVQSRLNTTGHFLVPEDQDGTQKASLRLWRPSYKQQDAWRRSLLTHSGCIQCLGRMLESLFRGGKKLFWRIFVSGTFICNKSFYLRIIQLPFVIHHLYISLNQRE